MMMASAVGDDQQQSWLPYESTTMKDCSQGFCSIYCPQWCYIVFPPPPPLDDQSDFSSGGTTLSPLVIAVIGILTSVFLLVSYYTIISKYCTNFDFLSRRRHHTGDDQEANGGGQIQHETLHVVASEGLDDDAIKLLATYKYKKRDWSLEGSDCSVCLSEFREDEVLRLLPKCGHAFHVSCIDTWLKSHSNCPLCRANIPPNCASVVLPMPTQRPSPPPECWTSPPADMIVLSAEASRRTREGANSNMTSGSQVTADATMEAKYLFMISRESEGSEQMRRSSSCLRNMMEIEDTGDHVEGSSRRVSGSENRHPHHRNRNHHYRWSSRTKASRSMMMSPVVMKRKSTCNGRSQNPIKYHQYSYQAEGNENSNDASILPV